MAKNDTTLKRKEKKSTVLTERNLTMFEKCQFFPKNCFFGPNIPLPSLSFRPINYSQVIISSLSQNLFNPRSALFSSILSTLAFVLNPLPLPARATLATAISIQAPDRSTSQQRNLQV